jgi:prepilin-type N-terminal cleavage/methylation domain-containing protein
MSERGFTLFEVLIALAVIALAVTAALGGIMEALKFSERMNQRTEAIAEMEKLLFELEAGDRFDLFLYGGEGKLEEGSSYRIQAASPVDSASYQAEFYREMKAALSLHDTKDSLELALLLRAAAS